jgi:restriction endonuclease Mrr
MDRRPAESLARLSSTRLAQLHEILARAQTLANTSRALGASAPSDQAWRQAVVELEKALADGQEFRQALDVAQRIQQLSNLPPGQRPAELVGPTPAELFDQTTSWDQLYPIKWWQFEHLVAETFRRLGFENVQVVNGTQTGDGGLDIRMSYQGAPCVVQCKHSEADEYVPIDKIRALAHVAQREQATAYLVTSGQVGVTARKEMATATPQVFLVDGERLWKWIGRGRGQNKEEVFLPGHATPAAGAKSGKARKAGCLTVLVACPAALAATLLCIQILT